ncbi:MAG: dihydrofolate reductase [Bacteroidales bacterium]|nr:dihydrofolate reductase [Bacteroidales bacterium]MBN2699440.1 dihydrofolate reductase [Bacteroidales bacterium]
MKNEIIRNISIIVAIAENNAIGKDNRLLWHLSEDLKRFKRITSGHSLIMGRNTYLSLPGGALPNRKNIVISNIRNESFPDCLMAYSIDESLKLSEKEPECFVIGGGMIYRQFLPLAARLYLTRVHHTFEADTYFPEIDFSEWIELDSEYCNADNRNEFAHTFTIYKKKII